MSFPTWSPLLLGLLTAVGPLATGMQLPAFDAIEAEFASAQGTVEVAANWWNNDGDSNLMRMITKGMLKNADGSPMKYSISASC